MLATLTLPAGHEMPELDRAAAAPKRVRVRSADELRNALRHARGHALTLDGSGLDRVLRLDPCCGTLELQAATPWSELARYLATRGIAIEPFVGAPCLPATVGEAVSQAAAGPDGVPVTAHVTALTLATPDGELRRADAGSNPGLFRLVLGGQGVIGVLYSVTLSIDSLRSSAAAAAAPVALELPQAEPVPATECSVEALVPPAALDAYLADVRALAAERRLLLLGISVYRYRQDASAFLCWAKQEWAGVRVRFGFRSTLGASVGALEVRRALLCAALERGGSFPIREARHATRRQLDDCYPMLAAFLAEKRRSDPAERLQNAWYREIAATMRREPLEIRWGAGEAS